MPPPRRFSGDAATSSLLPDEEARDPNGEDTVGIAEAHQRREAPHTSAVAPIRDEHLLLVGTRVPTPSVSALTPHDRVSILRARRYPPYRELLQVEAIVDVSSRRPATSDAPSNLETRQT